MLSAISSPGDWFWDWSAGRSEGFGSYTQAGANTMSEFEAESQALFGSFRPATSALSTYGEDELAVICRVEGDRVLRCPAGIKDDSHLHAHQPHLPPKPSRGMEVDGLLLFPEAAKTQMVCVYAANLCRSGRPSYTLWSSHPQISRPGPSPLSMRGGAGYDSARR